MVENVGDDVRDFFSRAHIWSLIAKSIRAKTTVKTSHCVVNVHTCHVHQQQWFTNQRIGDQKPKRVVEDNL